MRKQPVQERARATVSAILDGAVQVLLKDGHAALTTARVAARAGVSVGTLYQYFADKAALITAVRERHVALLASGAQRAMSQSEGLAPELRVAQVLTEFLKVKRENLALSRALLVLPAAPGKPAAETQRFAALIARHLLHGRPDAARAARIMASALEGATSHAVTTAPEWLSEPWFLEVMTRLALAAAGPDGRQREKM